MNMWKKEWKKARAEFDILWDHLNRDGLKEDGKAEFNALTWGMMLEHILLYSFNRLGLNRYSCGKSGGNNTELNELNNIYKYAGEFVRLPDINAWRKYWHNLVTEYDKLGYVQLLKSLNEPKEYPCLVRSFYEVGENEIIEVNNVFVYEEDIKKLMV